MDLPEAIEHVRPAVVQISIIPAAPSWPARPQPPQPLGTGFWVHSTGLAITANHVIAEARKVMINSPGSNLALGQAIPNVTSPQLTIRGSFNHIAADVIEEDQRHDIALVQARPNPFAAAEQPPFVKTPTPETDVYPLLGLATLSLAEVRDGERIAVSGYPLAAPTLVTTSGGIASAFETDIREVQAPRGRLGMTIRDVADSYLADVAVNPGNSGGPVYRISDGEIIGICVAFRVGQGLIGSDIFSYNSGLSVVVPIKYAVELISKHVTH